MIKTILNNSMLWLRGLVKLKKCKNSRKTRIGQTSPTHPLSNFLIFFGKIWKHESSTKNTKKHKISKKQIKIRAGVWPTHPLSSFSRIFGFFSTWQNPLAVGKVFLIKLRARWHVLTLGLVGNTRLNIHLSFDFCTSNRTTTWYLSDDTQITSWLHKASCTVSLHVNMHFVYEFTIVIFIHYKPRIAVAILDL